MTREEALNILHNASVYHPDYLDALNMSIKALEQEPCEDCISRQAAKKALENRFIELQKRHSVNKYETNFCLNTILELPSVTPKPKTGHWKYIGNGHNGLFECDNCGAHRNMFNELEEYCYACGARMECEDKE